MDTLIYQSAKALAKAIRWKAVSSYDVVTACMARICAVNPKINAVVQQSFAEALNDARQADEALGQGRFDYGSMMPISS